MENDYRRLCNEIMRLMLVEELFTFVTNAGVEGNNNASERRLRDDALARKTGHTSKTAQGAKRQSIVSSVLQSIGKQLGEFTLDSVIKESQRWLEQGRSCFSEQASNQDFDHPEPSPHEGPPRALLDRLILDADKCPPAVVP